MGNGRDVGGSDGNDGFFDPCVGERIGSASSMGRINRSDSHVGYTSSLWEPLAACGQ